MLQIICVYSFVTSLKEDSINNNFYLYCKFQENEVIQLGIQEKVRTATGHPKNTSKLIKSCWVTAIEVKHVGNEI